MTLHLQRDDHRASAMVVTEYEGHGERAHQTEELRTTRYPSIYSAFEEEQRRNGEPIAWNFYGGGVFYKSERGVLIALAEVK